MAPWNEKTFLTLLQGTGYLGTASSKIPTQLERCIALELRTRRIYEDLAKALSGEGYVVQFFNNLAEQEQHHAELLEVCRALSARSGWKANLFSPWQEALTRLEQQLDAAEASVRQIDSIDAALQLMLQIESSEIDQVASAALAATSSAFVQRLKPFRETMEIHVAYISEWLPKLSPQLMPACRTLQAKWPRTRH